MFTPVHHRLNTGAPTLKMQQYRTAAIALWRAPPNITTGLLSMITTGQFTISHVDALRYDDGRIRKLHGLTTCCSRCHEPATLRSEHIERQGGGLVLKCARCANRQALTLACLDG